jgi:hypothetical protein
MKMGMPMKTKDKERRTKFLGDRFDPDVPKEGLTLNERLEKFYDRVHRNFLLAGRNRSGSIEGPGLSVLPTQKPKRFEFSNDFRLIRLGRKNLRLNARQAETLQLLYTQAQTRPEDPWLIQNKILKKIQRRKPYAGALRDIFKSRPLVWKRLVLKDPRNKSLVRFNPKFVS